MSNSVIMTQEDVDRWTPVLEEHYRLKGKREDEIEDLISKVLSESQIGWTRAPRDLDTRIKKKSGYQCASHENLRPRKSKEKEEEKLEQSEADFDIESTLTPKEKEWVAERKTEYQRDFDFNISSDRPLLENLVLEEVIQKRVMGKQLKYSSRDYDKHLNNSLKRVTELQIKLGITREQRAGILDKIDGNVAQIAVDLDEKLAAMPEVLRKQYEEEAMYAAQKAQRPPVNVLPAIEKVEALLGGAGDVNANMDSSKMSEISETVAKEIANKREEKPPKVELAEGINI